MRIIKRIWWGSLCVCLLAACLSRSVTAQTPIPDEEYFPETGLYVSGEFLEYYRSLPDPLLYLGSPITGVLSDPSGKQFQYFQTGRLELDPTASKGKRVSIGKMGGLIYDEKEAVLANVPNSGPSCRYFSNTGFNVCYAFLQFYDAHEGEKYFGDPISLLEEHNGRTVQYFENVRMEWRPEAPYGQRVALTDLGKYFYDKVLKQRPVQNPDSGIIEAPTGLNVLAFVSHSLVTPNAEQTLYIIVQNQTYQPVTDAMVGVILTLDDGSQQYYRPNKTDQDGISTFSFNVGSPKVKEMVKVEVVATYRGLEKRSGTWYRIWY